MTGTAVPLAVAEDTALEWVRESLRRGGSIARRALSVFVSKPGRFSVIAPAEPGFRVGALADGGVIQPSVANMALAKAIEDLGSSGADVLYVEDNLRLPGDRALEENFPHYRLIEGSIVHWQLLSAIDGGEAVRLIRAASTAYPLNAFIGSVRPDTGDLQARDGADLAAAIASSIVVIVVSVFDGESFLIWDAIERAPEDSQS